MTCSAQWPLAEPTRALECLRKAARVAAQCMDGAVQAQLLAELLGRYALLRARRHPALPPPLIHAVSPGPLPASYRRHSRLLARPRTNPPPAARR